LRARVLSTRRDIPDREEGKKMAANIARYLVENSGPNESALGAGLREAIRICQRDGIPSITLLMETKQAFQGSVLATVLGPPISKRLAAGKTVKSAGIEIKLESAKTFSPYIPDGMIIGVHVGRGGLDALDSATSAKAIVLVPWLEVEGKRWMSVWNPTVLGKSTWTASAIDVPPEAEAALQRLTRTINLSTGLSHPSDEEFAKRTFAELKDAGKVPKPAEARKWAVRNGWDPRHADELEKLAKRNFK
jgi:hypothetical protein